MHAPKNSRISPFVCGSLPQPTKAEGNIFILFQIKSSGAVCIIYINMFDSCCRAYGRLPVEGHCADNVAFLLLVVTCSRIIIIIIIIIIAKIIPILLAIIIIIIIIIIAILSLLLFIYSRRIAQSTAQGHLRAL